MTNKSFSINSATFGAQGIQLDYNGGTPRLYAGDGSNTFLKYESGNLTVRTLKTSTSGKRIELNPSDDNELHFYGDRGDGTVELLCDIGLKASGTDYYLIRCGGSNYQNEGIIHCQGWYTPIIGISTYQNNSGLQGQANGTSGRGVRGIASNGYGGMFQGGKGAVYLVPDTSAGTPTHSAFKGTLYVDSNGVLYINTDGSTTWQKVGAQ